MYRAAYLIQEAFEDELPDGRYGQVIRSQLTAWITTERLNNLSVSRISDKDRAIIADASNEFKKFRAKMATYGDKLFRTDDEEEKKKPKPMEEEKPLKKKRARTPVDDKKEKKPKRKKKAGNDTPKRPLTSYMTFVKMNRQKVLDADPSAVFTEVGRKLGTIWKNLTPDEQKKYHDLAREDQERFGREMREWEMSK